MFNRQVTGGGGQASKIDNATIELIAGVLFSCLYTYMDLNIISQLVEKIFVFRKQMTSDKFV